MGIDRGHVCNLPKTVRQSVLTLRSNHGEDRNQLKLKKFSIG